MASVRAEGVAEALFELKRLDKLATFTQVATRAGFKPYWCDTVMVRSDEEVTVLTHYEDFTGTFVQHCHILPHEDMGMMELIEIVR